VIIFPWIPRFDCAIKGSAVRFVGLFWNRTQPRIAVREKNRLTKCSNRAVFTQRGWKIPRGKKEKGRPALTGAAKLVVQVMRRFGPELWVSDRIKNGAPAFANAPRFGWGAVDLSLSRSCVNRNGLV
jgi:hypothetical protein